jgi:hypothetical protein
VYLDVSTCWEAATEVKVRQGNTVHTQQRPTHRPHIWELTVGQPGCVLQLVTTGIVKGLASGGDECFCYRHIFGECDPRSTVLKYCPGVTFQEMCRLAKSLGVIAT